MTAAHLMLGLLGLLLAAESLWAWRDPAGLRARMRGMLDEMRDEASLSPLAFCWIFALICWAFAWFGQLWAHRVLFVAGVFFFVTGFFAHRSDFLETWYQVCLGRRSSAAIRVIYSGEAAVAGLLFYIAITAA